MVWRRETCATTLQTKVRAVVGRVLVRRVILWNGVRLYVQAVVLQASGANVLGCASKDIVCTCGSLGNVKLGLSWG